MHMNNDNDDDEKPPDVNNARPRTEKGTKRSATNAANRREINVNEPVTGDI